MPLVPRVGVPRRCAVDGCEYNIHCRGCSGLSGPHPVADPRCAKACKQWVEATAGLISFYHAAPTSTGALKNAENTPIRPLKKWVCARHAAHRKRLQWALLELQHCSPEELLRAKLGEGSTLLLAPASLAAADSTFGDLLLQGEGGVGARVDPLALVRELALSASLTRDQLQCLGAKDLLVRHVGKCMVAFAPELCEGRCDTGVSSVLGEVGTRRFYLVRGREEVLW